MPLIAFTILHPITRAPSHLKYTNLSQQTVVCFRNNETAAITSNSTLPAALKLSTLFITEEIDEWQRWICEQRSLLLPTTSPSGEITRPSSCRAELRMQWAFISEAPWISCQRTVVRRNREMRKERQGEQRDCGSTRLNSMNNSRSVPINYSTDHAYKRTAASVTSLWRQCPVQAEIAWWQSKFFSRQTPKNMTLHAAMMETSTHYMLISPASSSG